MMKYIKKHFQTAALLLGLLISTNACEDLAFGDKFLQIQFIPRQNMHAACCGIVTRICR